MIVIDPGHPSTPGDTGVVSHGLVECNYTLHMAKLVANAVAAMGLSWSLTREDHRVVSLSERGRIAREQGAGLVVSIHVDGYHDARARGLRAFYREGDMTSKDIADTIARCAPHRLHVQRRSGETANANWANVRHVLGQYRDMPAVLVECGYATNAGDRDALLNESVQMQLATAIAAGVARFQEIRR